VVTFQRVCRKLHATHLKISDVGSKDLDIFNGGIAYGMATALKVVLVYKMPLLCRVTTLHDSNFAEPHGKIGEMFMVDHLHDTAA
jgi:hypothetical protein